VGVVAYLVILNPFSDVMQNLMIKSNYYEDAVLTASVRF
jgi:hypothetical protein